MSDLIERLEAAAQWDGSPSWLIYEAIDHIRALEAQLAVGWLYFNPDTGTEWAEQHPIESGEVPDAQNVRAATAANLLKELVPAWADLANETKARRSALEVTPPAPKVTEDRPTHCGGCGETEPAKRCIGCLADFGPASLHQQETADDAMAGAAVHAIREMLNEIGVPQAAFIDDHVRNGLVWARRKALEEAAQVADDEAEIERSLTRREAAQSADYIAQRIRELKEGSASR